MKQSWQIMEIPWHTVPLCVLVGTSHSRKLEIMIWNGCDGNTWLTTGAENFFWRVGYNILVLTVCILEANMINIIRHSVWGFNNTRDAKQIGNGGFTTSMPFLSVSPIAVVRWDDLVSFNKSEIPNGWNCNDTTFHSQVKRLWMMLVMNYVKCSISTAKLGLMPNQTQTHSTPKRTWRSILSFMCWSCCVSACSMGIFSRWMRWFWSKKEIILLTTLSPAPVSRSHRTLCVICKRKLHMKRHICMSAFRLFRFQ